MILGLLLIKILERKRRRRVVWTKVRLFYILNDFFVRSSVNCTLVDVVSCKHLCTNGERKKKKKVSPSIIHTRVEPETTRQARECEKRSFSKVAVVILVPANDRDPPSSKYFNEPQLLFFLVRLDDVNFCKKKKKRREKIINIIYYFIYESYFRF